MNNQELLNYIVCPVCRGNLAIVENAGKTGFSCQTCGVIYPIENEIPMLLPESGIPSEQWRGDK